MTGSMYASVDVSGKAAQTTTHQSKQLLESISTTRSNYTSANVSARRTPPLAKPSPTPTLLNHFDRLAALAAATSVLATSALVVGSSSVAA